MAMSGRRNAGRKSVVRRTTTQLPNDSSPQYFDIGDALRISIHKQRYSHVLTAPQCREGRASVAWASQAWDVKLVAKEK